MERDPHILVPEGDQGQEIAGMLAAGGHTVRTLLALVIAIFLAPACIPVDRMI